MPPHMSFNHSTVNLQDLGVFRLDGTSQQTGSSGGDKTNLLTRRSGSGGSGWVTNVLMVTTTVRMLDRVHRDTSDTRPAVSLHFVLVEGVTCFQDWLFLTITTGNNTNNGSVPGGQFLSDTRRQTNHSLLTIFTVSDNDAGSSGSTAQSSSVGVLIFNHGDFGTFWHLSEREDVTDGQLGVLSTVHELTGVQTFNGDEQFLVGLVSVGITEDNLGQRSSSTRIMDDLFDETFDVTVSLGVINGSQAGLTLSVLGDGLKDASTTFSLTPDNTSHLGVVCLK